MLVRLLTILSDWKEEICPRNLHPSLEACMQRGECVHVCRLLGPVDTEALLGVGFRDLA